MLNFQSKYLFQLSLVFFLLTSGYVIGQKTGNASYYSDRLHGRHTSDGGKYLRDSMTCAHRTYPFGTILSVRNPKNDKEVLVKVTDRGPHQRRLMIDLSYRAAKELDIIRAGIATVEVTRLDSLPYMYPHLKPLPKPAMVFPMTATPRPLIYR